MKATTLAIIFAVLMASSYAWTPFKFRTQNDMLEYIRDEDHHIYILFFYNSGPDNKKYNERVVLKERESIRKNALDAFDDIYYAEIDLAKQDFDEVAHEIGIETADILEYPTVVALSDGIGKWVNGPNLSQLLIPTINALVAQKSQ